MGTKQKSQARTQKGCVSVEDHEGRIRLRWRHQGKRYCLSLGFPYNQAALKAARQIASRIELDVLAGHFDESLQAYGKKVVDKAVDEPPALTVVELWEVYTNYKAKTVQAKTLWNYKGVTNALEQYFGAKQCCNLTKDDVREFVSWYKTNNLEPHIQRDRLVKLSGAWDWAIAEKIIETNPWQGASKLIKVPPKQKPKPFTTEEVRRIIEAFRNNHYYSYYTPYVEFLFGTGCRPSELIGLQWKHISKDFKTLWIGSTLVRGERKSTKTNKDRTLVLTTRLREILMGLKQKTSKPEDLVFQSPNGKALRDPEFCRRAWRTILAELGLEYRKPYFTRSTFISHALEAGISPTMIAAMTGHSVQVLYEHYAAAIKAPQLPDIFT